MFAVELKSEFEIFDFVFLYRVYRYNIFGKESYNFKLFSKLKFNLFGIIGYV